MFIASNTVPWLQLPSPPKATLTLPVAASWQAMAAPTASGGPPPTMAFAPSMPLVEVGDVHRAALALAQAIRAAVDLLHHAAHVAALGDAVPVAAMGADDVVRIGQLLAHPDRDGLLAGSTGG